MILIPDFKTEPQRQHWLTENAEYFTVVRRHHGRYERHEAPTLEKAKLCARQLAVSHPGTRWMIYAVVQRHDTYVCTVTSNSRGGVL